MRGLALLATGVGTKERPMVATWAEQQGDRWPGPQPLGEILPAVLTRLGLNPVDLLPRAESTLGQPDRVESQQAPADPEGRSPRQEHR
jgi:hypothetical protein